MTIEVDGWARFAAGVVLALPMIIETTRVIKTRCHAGARRSI